MLWISAHQLLMRGPLYYFPSQRTWGVGVGFWYIKILPITIPEGEEAPGRGRGEGQRTDSGETPSQAREGNTERFHDHGAELRSRFQRGQRSDHQDANESDVDSRRAYSGDAQATESGGSDGSISVRLLQPQSSTSISVSPSTTLGEVRRWVEVALQRGVWNVAWQPKVIHTQS